ncbi:hypothetical protein [Litorimonas sp.]|uniref:hypothetical protein n=1 Tax=Litorimonas sp. TaxID=1892381 RepID=UPI003A86A266
MDSLVEPGNDDWGGLPTSRSSGFASRPGKTGKVGDPLPCHTDATLGSPGISALAVQRKTSSTDQDAKPKALAPGRFRLRRCN